MTGFHAIEAFIAAGQKINAIKEFRALTGVGLKEAKDAVEHFEAHRQWPAGFDREAFAAAAVAPIPTPQPGQPLRVIEDLVAQGQIIGAIKELRALTGVGLKESKDAVDEYRERGRWPGSLVARVEPSSAPPTPAAPPTPTPAPAHEGASPRTASASLRKALAEHLGHAPDIHLVAHGDRASREGYLVMLRDRACFVHTDRRWGIDPEIAYDAVRHVEVAPGAPAVLYVSFGHVHERIVLDAADAEAALALFRVFAP